MIMVELLEWVGCALVMSAMLLMCYKEVIGSGKN